MNRAPGWDAGSGPRAGRVCLVCVGGERGNQAAFGVGAGGPPGTCGAKGGIGACCLRVTGDLRSPTLQLRDPSPTLRTGCSRPTGRALTCSGKCHVLCQEGWTEGPGAQAGLLVPWRVRLTLRHPGRWADPGLAKLLVVGLRGLPIPGYLRGGAESSPPPPQF